MKIFKKTASSEKLINLIFTFLSRNRDLYKLRTFFWTLPSLFGCDWSHCPVCMNFNFTYFFNENGWIYKWILQPASTCALFPNKRKDKTYLPHHYGTTGNKLKILKQNASPLHSWIRLHLEQICYVSAMIVKFQTKTCCILYCL